MQTWDVSENIQRWAMPTGAPAHGMASLAHRPIVAQASGVAVFDRQGRRYLDFSSGGIAGVLGHNHARYASALKRDLHTVSNCPSAFLSLDSLELQRRLGHIVTPPLQKSLFLASGRDAIDAAFDIARAVTGGIDVISVQVAPQGRLYFKTTAVDAAPATPDSTGQHPLAAQSAAVMAGPYSYRCPAAADACPCEARDVETCCLAAAFEAALAQCRHAPAALIMEPILVEAGVITLPYGYMRKLRSLCHQHGMLFMVDESRTGIGRTGRMWGHQNDGAVPDVMIFSRHFGSALPVTALCATPDVADRVAQGNIVLRSTPCSPFSCVGSLSILDIVEEEGLLARTVAIGEQLKTRLAEMAATISTIGEVRGHGAIRAVELVTDRVSRTPDNRAARAVVQACESRGLLVQARGSHGNANVIMLAPPMISAPADIDEGADILADVLHMVANRPRLGPAALNA